jgi:hypothetical protein
MRPKFIPYEMYIVIIHAFAEAYKVLIARPWSIIP